MKKRILSVFMALCMMLTLLPATALAADTPPTKENLEAAERCQKAFKDAYDSNTMDWDILFSGVGSYSVVKGATQIDNVDNAAERIEALKTYYEGIESLSLANKPVPAGEQYTGLLAELTQLEELDLTNTGINKDFYGAIAGLENLKTVNLSNNTEITAENIGGLLKTNQSAATGFASSVESLDLSGTGITNFNFMWIDSSASMSSLKTLTAQGLELTSVAGLVEIASARGFSASGLTWDLSGSSLSKSHGDGISNLDHVKALAAAFKSDGTFSAPTVEGVAVYLDGAPYDSLEAAVAAANNANGGTITLADDVTLTQKVTVSKDITIVGGKHTIIGVSDNADVNFTITGGTLTISDATLTGFGDTAGSVVGAGVFKIPADASGAKLVATGLTVEKFNRAAFDFRNGSFEITDCTIDCDNQQAARLTKGIVAWCTDTTTITGTVDGCRINGSNSTYEGWESNGIEISAGATVTIKNTTINSVQGGISVALNAGHGKANVTVEDCTITGKLYSMRIFESDAGASSPDTTEAKLTVNGGTYNGPVQIYRKDGNDGGNSSDGNRAIQVESGKFDSSVAKFADSTVKYEVQNADGSCTYHKTQEEALQAAGPGAVIKPIDAVVNPGQDTYYTVTVNTNTSAGSYQVSMKSGETFTLPAAPAAPSGKTFGGWWVGGTLRNPGTTWTVTADISVDAHWNTIPTPPSTGGGSSTGGSSGSSSSGESVTVDRTTGGSVQVRPGRAESGETVTIIATPNDGYEVGEVTVTDRNGKELDVRSAGDNRYTFTMPSTKVDVKVDFVRIGGQQPAAPSFWDVSNGAYYADAVRWAVEQGITTGTTANTFSPNSGCTRAQIVTFLWRANGSPAPRSAENPFTDVNGGAYYADAVLWAVEQGITGGTTATTFSPNSGCTRAQAATFLWRASGSPAAGESSFSDVADSAYYADAVDWAVANSVTQGTTAGTFSPNAACTRAQIVTFLYRAMA